MNTSSQEGAGVFRYKPHTGAVARLVFDALDENKLISTSYDGTARRMDVDKGAFEQASNLREKRTSQYYKNGGMLFYEAAISGIKLNRFLSN